MSDKNLSCYVLMVAKTFPASTEKAGQPTNFKEKIERGDKIHTVRKNYPFWKKRFEKIDRGDAYISLREWTGKPYKSKQKEIGRLYKSHCIGIQSIEGHILSNVYIDKWMFDLQDLAKNDGLTVLEFNEWFNGIDYGEDIPCIIHFTDFRYNDKNCILPF